MSAAARFNEGARSKGWPLVCDERLGFELTKLKEAHAYWCGLAAKRAIPARSDLSPHGMKSFLSLVSVGERDKSSAGRWKMRLQGSDMDRVYGPMTGRYFDDVLEPGFLARWMACIGLVSELRKPMRFLSEVSMGGRDPVVMEGLLAPLSSDGENVDMVFNVSAIRAHETWDKVRQSCFAGAG